MLVADPKNEKLSIEVKDSLVFTDLTVGTAEVCHLSFCRHILHFVSGNYHILGCGTISFFSLSRMHMLV